MLKILLLLISLVSLVFSKVYYSKVEPYEIRNIVSNVSGKVTYTSEDMLGKKLSSKSFIQIDDKLDKDELKSVKNRLNYLNESLKEDNKIILNLKDILKRKKDNFNRIKSMKIKSKVEKDREFYDLVNTQNSYLSTLKEMNSLKTSISNLKFRKEQLKKTIKDKHIKANGFVLYTLNVKVGNSVNIGTLLAKVADVSRGILTVYLDRNDLKDLKDKVIYIDGIESDYKFSRVINIADTENISRYKAQIIVKAPKIFSKVVKIELKELNNEK